MIGLLDSYEKRKAKELFDLGLTIHQANHDPQALVDEYTKKVQEQGRDKSKPQDKRWWGRPDLDGPDN